tara:strand:- start:2258 stop:3745 length:1488 start_codon:yes stop_codon:yes gene_type:complete
MTTAITPTNFRQAISDWADDFADAQTKYGHIKDWDVSQIQDMSSLFVSMPTAFNPQGLGNWNMSNVTDTSNMFNGAGNFNRPIGSWDMSKVENMSGMFNGATSFNKPIGSWNMSNVTDTNSMFLNAMGFNQDISGWNMGKVEDTNYMFNGAIAFNQPINDWNMVSVTNASNMFDSAIYFNQDISGWDMGSVTDTSNMFRGANVFNQPINDWNLDSLDNMDYLFHKALSFNQDISGWDFQNITSAEGMFLGASKFNYDLSGWNVEFLVDASGMFMNATSFNQDLSYWKLINLSNATNMFNGASDFSQNHSTWGNLNSVTKTNIDANDATLTLGTGLSWWEQELVDAMLEFQQQIINEFLTLTSTISGEPISFVSEGVPFMSGPRYGFISIDDHQTNTRGEFQVVYGDSVRDDNIITRINLAPRNVHTLSLRDAGMASLVNKTRTYTGPVDIKKLTIKLYDEYGRIIDLNNTDWSFTLEFEKEIKRLVAPAYDSNDA